jgi:hypothetical protein
LLRPDLFGDAARESLDEVDAARAREYALLATLIGRSPDGSFLKRLAQLRGDATPLGLAHAALGDAAERAEALRSAANTLISSSVSAGASCCPTRPTT